MSPGSGNSTEKGIMASSVEKQQDTTQNYDKAKNSPSTSIVVLDGGFATQLSCHVNQPIDGDVLWSARFLATDPKAVIDTHLDFLRGKFSNRNKPTLS